MPGGTNPGSKRASSSRCQNSSSRGENSHGQDPRRSGARAVWGSDQQMSERNPELIETLILVFERCLGWVWNRARPLPVHLKAGHHDLYEISSITLAIGPAAVDWANVHRETFYNMQREGGISFVVPTALVVTISNGEATNSKPVYLREVHLDVLDYLPVAAALKDKSGIVLRAIQAGGRGADARFRVAFDATHGASFRLLRAARSSGYDGPTRMRIDPGRFAEVLISPWPSARRTLLPPLRRMNSNNLVR